MYQHGYGAIALPRKQEGRAHLRCLNTRTFGEFCKLAGHYIKGEEQLLTKSVCIPPNILHVPVCLLL